MTAKQYLRKIRNLDKEVDSYLEQIEILTTQASKVTTTIKHGPAGTGDVDKMAVQVAKIVDLKSKLDERLQKCIELKARAIMQIEMISDSRYKLVLTNYYLNKMTWEQVAVAMNCSYQWAHRLHGQALIEFQKILEKDSVS